MPQGGGLQANAGIAAQLASSQMYFGDCTGHLKSIDKTGAVRPEDFIAAVRANIVDAPITGIIVADQLTLATVDTGRYEVFTGNVE
jgi:hypothetical protein